MRRTHLFIGLFVAAVALAAPAPAGAQDSPPSGGAEQAERIIKEGIARILRGLDQLIGSVPQYEMPEVLENGDIIIRRKRPEAEHPPAERAPGAPDGDDQTVI